MSSSEPQTYRNALSFRNSPEAIRRFPFPFASDHYETAANLEQNNRAGPTEALQVLFDVDEHYSEEIAEKAFVLSRDPLRCQVLPHMDVAQWDVLELVMTSLSRDFPQFFSLDRAGNRCRWQNRQLGIDQNFLFGERESLPLQPFEYIARQVQGDLVLLDQRSDMLYLDGGLLTAAQGWSLHFNLGMSWPEIHGPVAGTRERAVIDRGLSFALKMPPGISVRRPNWVLCVTPRLDNSLETIAEWGHLYSGTAPGNIGDDIMLRVEMQQLYRLPRSNAILFGIRVYMLSLAELTTVNKWASRLHRVLRDLDPSVVAAKGLPFLPEVVGYLSQFDGGLQ